MTQQAQQQPENWSERAKSLEAERAVLSAALVDAGVVGWVDCDVDCFTLPAHRHCWEAMAEMLTEGMRPDEVTLPTALVARGVNEQVAREVVLSLVAQPYRADNVAHYAEILRGHQATRATMLALSATQERVVAGRLAGAEVLDDALERLSRVRVGGGDGAIGTDELAAETMAELEQFLADRDAGGEVWAGVPTGIATLDRLTGGTPLSKLTILGGLAGAGKSTLALAWSEHAAAKGFGAHLLSYEDRRKDFGERLLSMASGVPVQQVHNGELDWEQRDRLRQAAEEWRARPRFLVEQVQGLSTREAIRRVRGRAAENKTRLVLVDYIQRIPPTRPGQKAHEAIEENLQLWADFAGRDDCAVVIFSQLKDPERGDIAKWVPLASEFFNSRAIKHLGKLIIGLKYPADHSDEARPNVLELHVLKHNQGEKHIVVEASCDRTCCRVYGGAR